MRCYKVVVASLIRYTATQADSRAVRDLLLEETNTKKTNAQIEQVEIPVAKAELLAFLNEQQQLHEAELKRYQVETERFPNAERKL